MLQAGAILAIMINSISTSTMHRMSFTCTYGGKVYESKVDRDKPYTYVHSYRSIHHPKVN